MGINNFLQNLLQLFLSYMEVNLKGKLIAFYFSVHKSQILRDDLVKEQTSQRCVNNTCLHSSVRHCLGYADLNL